MYKYAIIGFGGLGKLLLTNLIKLEHERCDFHLQAICGADPKTFTQNVKINIGDIDMSSMDFSDCNFYKDYKELIDTEELDLHIHDVDLINWIFGEPNSIHSSITEKKVKRESIFTQYYYDDLLVLSSADWSFPKTFEFESRCIVNFEKATIVIDNEKFIGYQDDIVFKPDVADENDYELEMRAMLEYFLDDIPCLQTSPESVRNSVRLALKEVETARTE